MRPRDTSVRPRPWPPLGKLGLLLLLSACAAEPAGPSPLALRDPLGLMDVTQDLRLVIFPSTERGCNGDGTLTPPLPEDPTTELPMATVDRRFPVDELEQRVIVEEGSYVIAVQGWGTDPVTMRTGVLVTRGCAPSVIEAGQERPVTITMQDIEGMGLCNDGVLSPDEQCEMATGPFPCDPATCRTVEQVANTTTDGTQDAPSVDWIPGGRLVIGYRNGATELRFVFLNERAERITSPSALGLDEAIDEGSILAGVQTLPDVAVSIGRVGAALQDLSTMTTEGGDVMARFFNTDRTAEGPPTLMVPSPGAQTRPRIALTSDGTALVVFSDTASASGATAALVPPGSTAPSMTFPLGTTGATTPAVATDGSQFIVVWVEAGAVQAQRFGTDGVAVDATPIAVSESADPGLPDVALMADGRAYLVWASGSGVRGRALDGSGTPGDANDLTGSGMNPRVTAGGGRFVAVWQAGANVEARYLDGNGRLADNHEQPRTTDAFVVGAGTGPDVAAGGDGTQAAAAVTWAGTGGDVLVRTLPLP